MILHYRLYDNKYRHIPRSDCLHSNEIYKYNIMNNGWITSEILAMDISVYANLG